MLASLSPLAPPATGIVLAATSGAATSVSKSASSYGANNGGAQLQMISPLLLLQHCHRMDFFLPQQYLARP